MPIWTVVVLYIVLQSLSYLMLYIPFGHLSWTKLLSMMQSGLMWIIVPIWIAFTCFLEHRVRQYPRSIPTLSIFMTAPPNFTWSFRGPIFQVTLQLTTLYYPHPLLVSIANKHKKGVLFNTFHLIQNPLSLYINCGFIVSTP